MALNLLIFVADTSGQRQIGFVGESFIEVSSKEELTSDLFTMMFSIRVDLYSPGKHPQQFF